MGLFSSLLGDKKPNQSLSYSMRDTLFADKTLEQWPPQNADTSFFPWNKFAEAKLKLGEKNIKEAIKCWWEVLADSTIEPRMTLQVWHFLRIYGQFPDAGIAKRVLGVVVEVGMPQGLDLLAAYSDNSARYYNFARGGIVWEHPDHTLDTDIDRLLSAANGAVAQIGVWEKPRLPAPGKGITRFSFLTPSGLYFGQGPSNDLAHDPIGQPIYASAALLMKALVDKAK